MKRRALRRLMRARKKALRKDIAVRRTELRGQIRRNPLLVKKRQRRRRRQIFALAATLAILLLVLGRCSCGPPPPPPPEPPPKDAGPVQPDAGVRVKSVTLNAPHLGKHKRATLPIEPLAPPPWLEEFHLQVAARSPRLSECFKGQEKPGAIRWTTSVNSENGAVSEPEFEFLGDASWLTGQRDCVTEVLSKPPYKFKSPPPPSATPPRVSLVLEF